MSHSQQYFQKITEFLNQGVVIVVDTGQNYRKTIKRYLQNLKVDNTKIVDSIDHCRQDLSNFKVSLLIVEWEQKGQNGIQLCREIRNGSNTADIPFLLTSAESLRGDIMLASEVGVDGFLLKPFSYEDFCQQLMTLIRNSEKRVQFYSLVEEAEQHLQNNRVAEAEQLFEESIHLRRGSARALCGLSFVHRRKGDTDKAIELLKEAIALNPHYIQAYGEIINIYDRSQDPHHTLHYAIKAHELSPENPRYLLTIAKAYLEIGRPNESEDFFKKTIAISPMLAEGHKGLGDVQYFKEDYKKAMKHYDKALDLDKDDVGILNAIGMVFVKEGQFQDGIQRYILALQMQPGNPKVLFNLGYAYEKSCRFMDAKDAYDRALISEPEFDKPKRRLQLIQSHLKTPRKRRSNS